MRLCSFSLLLCLCLTTTTAHPQTGWQPTPGHPQIAIWPGAIPDAAPVLGPETVEVSRPNELIGGKRTTVVRNVTTTTMTIYSPTGKNTGAASVVFPGGATKCWPSTSRALRSATGSFRAASPPSCSSTASPATPRSIPNPAPTRSHPWRSKTRSAPWASFASTPANITSIRTSSACSVSPPVATSSPPSATITTTASTSASTQQTTRAAVPTLPSPSTPAICLTRPRCPTPTTARTNPFCRRPTTPHPPCTTSSFAPTSTSQQTRRQPSSCRTKMTMSITSTTPSRTTSPFATPTSLPNCTSTQRAATPSACAAPDSPLLPGLSSSTHGCNPSA